MTAGYSGTPLAKKLGIESGVTVVALDAPTDCPDLLEPIPEGAQIVAELPGDRHSGSQGNPRRLAESGGRRARPGRDAVSRRRHDCRPAALALRRPSGAGGHRPEHQQPPMVKEQCHQKSPDAAVAVEVGMERLELDVDQPCPHERRQMIHCVNVVLERAQHRAEKMGRRRDECSVAGASATDPVLINEGLLFGKATQRSFLR